MVSCFSAKSRDRLQDNVQKQKNTLLKEILYSHNQVNKFPTY